MRIMVFDVPAESGGALSVLKDFYNSYKSDLDNEYIFVISRPDMKDTSNIKVLRFHWIKKSWLHRLYFDYFVAPKLIKRFMADKVLSLQNIIIPNTKVPQTVFIHNALPLAEYRFSIFEDKLLWVYQNILGRSIFRSIIKAQKVIVQTQWMKKKCTELLGVDPEKIKVMPPETNIEVKRRYSEVKENLAAFFYPASGVSFKNHKIIIDACIKLKEQGIKDYSVVFTLKGNENKNIVQLYKTVIDQELPIKFVGSLPREAVFEYYSKCMLIFPSYIETVGLPLLEAKLHETPIIAADCDFSHEILDGYNNVLFFNPFDKNKLSAVMAEMIKRR